LRSVSLRCAHLLLGCCLVLQCAASAALPARTLRFEQLSVEQGLAQELVTAIAQDQQGFMWFGSQNGLSRFDGYRVIVYKNIANDSRSLADNWIQALYVDDKGRLWIGTRSGLERYDAATDSFISCPFDASIKTDSERRNVHAIIGDGHGQLWLATKGGLQHYDPESGRFFILSHDAADAGSLSNDNVTAIVRDAQDNLWVGMGAGIDVLVPGATHFRHFRLDSAAAPDATQNEVHSLLIDQKQIMWIVTTSGLETWQLGKDVPHRHRFGRAEGLRSRLVTATDQDPDGNLWLGTEDDGLLRWDVARGRFVSFPTDPHSAAGKEVSTLYHDHTGTLWVGSLIGGVKYVDLASGGFNRFFHVPDDANSLANNKIFCVVSDGDGRLWLGSYGNPSRLDPKSNEITGVRQGAKHPGGISNDEAVLSIFRDKYAQLWAGTARGVGRFDPATGKFTPHLFYTGDPNSDSITQIVGDRSGMLWIASRGGLHRFDSATGKVWTFRHDSADAASLTNNWVKMTLEDRHGSFWVATDDGLDLLDRQTGRFTHFHHGPDAGSLSSDRVQFLFEDKKGILWVGTNDGLNRVDKNADGTIRFHTYTTNDGLGDDSIGGILEDDDGHLWMSTVTGISRMDTATDKFQNYTAHDGMVEGYYYIGSAFRDHDGTLYFGGVNGLTAFRPEDIHDNPYPPPVSITDVQISGQSVYGSHASKGIGLQAEMPDRKTLTLSYRQSVFSVEFSALHYADSRRNRFAYQLVGFDKDWVYINSSKRVATYTNLDPGHYVFRVRAANKDGIWNETGATLAVTILPPFWKTWWFRLGAAALCSIALWLAYRARLRVLTDQKIILEAQVRERTSEVVQQKEIVERKNELLQHAQEQLQHYFEDRERLFISISHDLRTPITRLQLRSGLLDDDSIREEFHEDLDELEKMVKGALQGVKDNYIHETSTEVPLDILIGRLIGGAQLAGHEVSYVQSGLSVIAKPLALKRAIGNLLDNALYYGERVEISARAEAQYVEIQIRDHGPGVAEEAFGSLFQSYVRLEHGHSRNENGMGLGLGIARSIVQAHGGELFLENHPDGGLIATIRLPTK
jgi:ligand-binding sensor domain-containing protein/signal transduction histidine kinase